MCENIFFPFKQMILSVLFYISEVINSAHSQELRLNIFFAILHLENNILQKKVFLN